MIYDLIIIGLGPAGISAAIYAKRGGLNTLVLESKGPGGLLNYTNIVDNYPGFPQITGPDLAYKMYEHFKTFNYFSNGTYCKKSPIITLSTFRLNCHLDFISNFIHRRMFWRISCSSIL